MKVYVTFEGSLGRVSSFEHDSSNVDNPACYVTNVHVQHKTGVYAHGLPTVEEGADSESINTVIYYHEIVTLIQRMHPEINADQHIRTGVKSMLNKYFKAMRGMIETEFNETTGEEITPESNTNYSALCGFDVHMDEDLNFWCFELNPSTGLRVGYSVMNEEGELEKQDSEFNLSLFPGVVEGAFRIINGDDESNTFELCYDSEQDKDSMSLFCEKQLSIFKYLRGANISNKLNIEEFMKICEFLPESSVLDTEALRQIFES
jgi:hypothetical protein